MKNEETAVMDVKEALLALMSNSSLRDAGIDEAFVEQFSLNMANYDSLPASTRAKIKDQFTDMASVLSELEGVSRKHSEERVRALARWFQGVNLLLAQNKERSA